MSSNNKKLIAVIGATGQQGGGVLRALQASGQFKVRALTRNPGKHRELADEVVEVVEVVTLAVAGALVVLFWHECLTSARQAFRRPGCTAVTRCVTGPQPPSP